MGSNLLPDYSVRGLYKMLFFSYRILFKIFKNGRFLRIHLNTRHLWSYHDCDLLGRIVEDCVKRPTSLRNHDLVASGLYRQCFHDNFLQYAAFRINGNFIVCGVCFRRIVGVLWWSLILYLCAVVLCWLTTDRKETLELRYWLFVFFDLQSALLDWVWNFVDYARSSFGICHEKC